MNLLELLREFGADEALITLVEQWLGRDQEGAEALTDDQLVELREGLQALADDDEASGVLLNAAADVVVEVRSEENARDEAAAQEEREAEDARRRLRGEPVAEEEQEPEAEEEAETPEGDEPAETPAEDAEGEPATEEDRQPVSAGAARRSAAARRQPRHAAPARRGDGPGSAVRFTWADGVPGQRAGTVVAASNLREALRIIDGALERRWDSFRGGAAGLGSERVRVASIVEDFAPDRRLTGDPAHDGRLIEAVLSGFTTQEAITAAGGYCAPLSPIYTIPTWGDTDQPLMASLPTFDAPRGGAMTLVPPALPQITGGFGIWTKDDDVDAATDELVRKDCYVVPCAADPRTSWVEALYRCLEWGVLQTRTFGEWTRAWTDLTMVAEARFMEQRRWTQILAKCLALDNQATIYSATRDLLNYLDQVAWGIRDFYRLDEDFPFRVVLPGVVRTIVRRDIANALPGGSIRENFTQAAAILNEALRERALNVTWTRDMHLPGPQAADTPAADLPPQIQGAIYPEGSFILLRNGELDLGVYRDGDLIKRNSFATFFERWDVVHQLGIADACRSFTINLCPSGAVAGTKDPTGLCASYT